MMRGSSPNQQVHNCFNITAINLVAMPCMSSGIHGGADSLANFRIDTSIVGRDGLINRLHFVVLHKSILVHNSAIKHDSHTVIE